MCHELNVFELRVTDVAFLELAKQIQQIFANNQMHFWRPVGFSFERENAGGELRIVDMTDLCMMGGS